MKWIKQSISLVAFSLPIFLELATIPSLPTQAQAQVDPAALTQQQPQLMSQVFNPPKRGLPPASAGGATRGDSFCVQKNQLLTPLLPKEKLGLTFSERPSFFWHVPQNTVKTAEFIIYEVDQSDANDDVVYETTLTLPTTPGIMKFTLPASSSPLKVGKRYHWYLTLICDDSDFKKSPEIEGWIERTQPEANLSKALEQANLRKRPALYAEAGIWHEALASLVELRCTEPNNFKVTVDWRKFLQSVGLSEFTSDPIIDCCTNKQS
ncbi:hypothetical protein NIES2100_47320 [Calothrix sp. NIES-2100]|uniref:DUF928 domain-containing protein n=1 Tax=Calothrix sp. NIES-2100 TaxID=1954172 RepID=UPI000B5E552F|nr:hypothetical protein NIES2100_47320 [Calothrix sp. NIES-2100]